MGMVQGSLRTVKFETFYENTLLFPFVFLTNKKSQLTQQ